MAKPAAPAASASSFSFFDDEILGGEEEAPSVEVDCFTRVEKEMTGYSSELKVSHARNPVAWWQERLGIYPILTRVALRHLMIPATSVPSERVFSTAGAIVNKKRATLHSDNVNMLIFLHDNYRKFKEMK